MRTNKELLDILQAKVDARTEEYMGIFFKDYNTSVDTAVEFLRQHFPKYRGQIAADATDIIHISITDGVDNKDELIKGILAIVQHANLFERVMKRG